MRRVLLLLVVTVFALTGTAAAATPADPRITAAVAAWKTSGLYVDPDFASVADSNETLKVIAGAKLPVYVAVLPTGGWFPEKDDTELLAGRLAAANGKPGVYVVMDGYTSHGVANNVEARAYGSTYSTKDQPLSSQLQAYLDTVKQDAQYQPRPARSEPIPEEPESSYPEEKFTVGKAVANGGGGAVLGLMGGGILGGVVLLVAAMTSGRREGKA
ncbi:hypothetical protein PWY87_19770 [Kribbella solani]|uniref:hypothetical protein n=1 Tax=Kribbella solani TaxID=236067 RepID=UPI0029AFA2F8|nr:hypothetical protein [Kribbella solani]MDX2968206.1 hypothetical protein [Kribbella solani]MDX3003937.1 hypothetical protein [Kribbella solani]